MKRKLFNIVLIIALTAGFPSCSGSGRNARADADSVEVAETTATEVSAKPDAVQPVAKSTDPFTCPDSLLYAARIVEDGRVQLAFNEESCKRMVTEVYERKWRPEALTVDECPMVRNISGVVELLQTNNGGGVNPYLYMRTADGHVAMLCIVDVLRDGDMLCSGPLSFVSGATGVKETIGDEGTVIYAVDKAGHKTEIQTAALLCNNYSIGDGYCLDFSEDWDMRFYYPAPKGIDIDGTFQPASVKDLNPDDTTRHYVAKLGPHTVRFTIEEVDERSRAYIRFDEVPERLANATPNCPIRTGAREQLLRGRY